VRKIEEKTQMLSRTPRKQVSYRDRRKILRDLEDRIWRARGRGISRKKIEEVVNRALNEYDDELGSE
jgi:hypothetical protein